jgi:hypothetical protein
MKNSLKTIFSNRAVAFAMLATISFSACTKKEEDPDYRSTFAGTWTIQTNTCGSTGVPMVIKSGSSKNTISIDGNAGSGSCNKTFTASGTTTASNFVIPAYTVTDNCGLSYTFTTTGTLNGNVLTIVLTASGAVNGTCTSTCVKQ